MVAAGSANLTDVRWPQKMTYYSISAINRRLSRIASPAAILNYAFLDIASSVFVIVYQVATTTIESEIMRIPFHETNHALDLNHRCDATSVTRKWHRIAVTHSCSVPLAYAQQYVNMAPR